MALHLWACDQLYGIWLWEGVQHLAVLSSAHPAAGNDMNNSAVMCIQVTLHGIPARPSHTVPALAQEVLVGYLVNMLY